jgi:hypothetical protein
VLTRCEFLRRGAGEGSWLAPRYQQARWGLACFRPAGDPATVLEDARTFFSSYFAASDDDEASSMKSGWSTCLEDPSGSQAHPVPSTLRVVPKTVDGPGDGRDEFK